ncbi:AAA family ATPase [Mesorhizobium sp. M1076]|uniref:AAA family ATPase n=1 Tax=Mesorhizobium sp. M1076 TaxID=2957054 RepID=UPI003337EAFC
MRLKSITIENFRSINGSITVGLDAPIILIHGPNGSGKTSLLSAIEIGLLGHSAALGRVDPDYQINLPHQTANSVVKNGKINLQVDLSGTPKSAELTISSSGVNGSHILSPEQAHFFSERCYLAQSAMGRLLDLYQHQEKKADSALTKFVKDLLGLDQFDALIDGLHPAGNVTRLREPVPEFWGAREDIPKLTGELEFLDVSIGEQRDKNMAIAAQFRSEVEAILPAVVVDANNLDAIRPLLHSDLEQSDLQSMAGVRRTLIAIQEQWNRAEAAGGLPDIARLEASFARVTQEISEWNDRVGSTLQSVVTELRSDFPDLQLLDSASPISVRSNALSRLSGELARLTSLQEKDEEYATAIASLQESIAKGDARISSLDIQIAGAAGDADGLANALASLQPHIHDDECPVCNRNYREVPGGDLAAHVSSNISKLVDASGRLQSLIRDKSITTSAIADARRELDLIGSRRLDPGGLNDLKTQAPRVREIALRLEQLEPGCAEGEPLYERFVNIRAQLASLRSANETVISLRNAIGDATKTLSVAPLTDDEPVSEVLPRLMAAMNAREANLENRLATRRQAVETFERWITSSSQLEASMRQADGVRGRLTDITRRKAEADRRIDVAKSLSTRAVAARTALVRRVFNEDLNEIWKDLFVRLAPDEPFIPAFAIPKSTGPVEALLKTIHRDGGEGGNPRAMLSAGNLNTAALTLFLSLHLSVHPMLPWLIIDDPVQSMDEVHIAQFAALLRTLSKQLGRQIIIAVHEKDLFDYLALELSPAFLDDRLITVDIGRSAIEETTAPWLPHIYAVDRAVAA